MKFFQRIGLLLRVTCKLIALFFEVLWGTWKVSRLQSPIVTIFGGARMPEHDFYFKQAHQLAQQFVEIGISVLTGGGPGLMQAANCGAFLSKKSKALSMGIGVKGIEEMENPCVHTYLRVHYFFVRKWLLTSYSQGFVVFPGGFGTLDEFSEILTLLQTKKTKKVPVILVGREYWTPLINWIKDEALVHNLIRKSDLDFFVVTDDIEQVYCIIRDECPLQPFNATTPK